MNYTDNHTLILPGNIGFYAYLGSIYRYRAVLRTFIIREIKAKYAQTYFGILWSIIQAVVALSIITLFFGYLMKVDTGPVPYAVFAFPGMIAWYYFSFIIGYSGSSLIQSQQLIQKMNFPKILLPVSRALVGLVDFVIWTALLLLLMIVMDQPFSFRIFAVPVFMLIILVTGLSISVWLSALTVRYRDLLIILPFIIGFGIFVTPVFFPGTMVPGAFTWVLYLNPMAGIIEALRWSFLNTGVPSAWYLTGLVPVSVLLVSGVYYFMKMEARIADEL